MFSHDRLDGFGRFIGVIEWDGGDVMMEDMSLDDAVEEVSSDESKFPIDGRCCSSCEVPGFRLVVRQGWIGVLEIGDGHLIEPHPFLLAE